VSGVAGGAAGQWGGKYLGDVIINGTKITSPVLQGAVSGAAGGAAGGYAGGFTAGLIMTGDFGEANSAGWQGAAFGAPIGGISGSVSAYQYADKKGINPWTGKELATKTGMSTVKENVLLIKSKQLQAKFKHAEDFGVTGNYNKANADKFSSAINQHINSKGVQSIQGTYRGQSVIHYVNPNTGLNVISSPSGQFISGWRLNPAQLQNVLKHGGL
jgi:hypothetical protein